MLRQVSDVEECGSRRPRAAFEKPTTDAEAHLAVLRVLIQMAQKDFYTCVMLFSPPEVTEFVWSRLHRYLIEQCRRWPIKKPVRDRQ